MPADDRPLAAPPPRGALRLLHALLPRAERDEVLADLRAEHAERAAAAGAAAADRWLWAQAIGSAPALLRWSWWRGWTGYAPPANTYRPGGPVLRHWLADARYAVRRLRNRPLYTLLAVLTLALGIGGSAAVFGIARPLLFAPLPYAHADEVAAFWMAGWWTEEEFLHLRGRVPGFQAVGAHRPGDLTLRDGDAPARLLPGLQVTAELFDVLGARPALGRGFRSGDDAAGAEPVVVISHGLWQELGGTPDVVGRRLMLDGAPRTVVGVMPRGFWFPDPAVRLWHARPLDPEGRNGSYTLVGRVAPGEDPARMAPQVRRLTAMLDERFDYGASDDRLRDAAVTPLRRALLGDLRPAVLAGFLAMGLILLIACANVAALMLGQVEGRSTEFAVRSAIGAHRGRLAQQLVIEALLLGVGAAAAGAALAAVGFRVLARSLPIGAWAESATFDWTMFVAALALAITAVLLVVLVPTAVLWRGNLRDALSRSRTGGLEGRGGRLELGLVVVEVALAMLIASASALLVRSVGNLYAIDPGVRTEGIAVVDVLSRRDMPAAERGRLVEEVRRALDALPAVRSAAVTMKLPLRGGGDSFGLGPEGSAREARTNSFFRVVSPTYFATMDMRLTEGRTFDAWDRPIDPDSAGVMAVVVNETFARLNFPGQSALGRTLAGGMGDTQRVVGVVADVAEGALTDAPMPTAYYLGGQVPWFGNREVFVLRTARPDDAAAVLDAARRTVHRLAPDLAVQETTTMARVFDVAVGPARQIMLLLTLLSTLALALGAVGIYGVMAHFAARRKRDWAIRVALGLHAGRVVRHLVGQGALLVALGVVLGAVGTTLLARLLASFLYGVGTVDPIAFATASALLLAVGVLAALPPARRAGTVNPAVILREE